MTPLFIVVIATILLRGVGLLGASRLSSWRASGLYAVAIMFVFTGATHFTVMRHDYTAMLPDAVPGKLGLIYLSGALQVAGAIGLLISPTRRVAGTGLVLLLIAMFPGNVYAALNGVPFRGEPPTPLWLRTPIQIFLVAMVWWTSIGERQGRAERDLMDRREQVPEMDIPS